MRRMALDHHAASGGEGRCRVAARDREGERKIARPEHRHRAERDLAQAQIGFRRTAARVGMIDPQPLPFAKVELFGKQAQLLNGTRPLAGDAGFGKSAFLRRARDQRRAELLDLRRDPAQEGRPRGAGKGTEDRLGRGCGLAGVGHVPVARLDERRIERTARFGACRGEMISPGPPFPGDEIATRQHCPASVSGR